MQYLDNRYTRLALLAIGISLLLWALFAITTLMIGIEVPLMLQAFVSFLAGGLFVAKFLSNRVF